MLASYNDKALKAEKAEAEKTRRLIREMHARALRRLTEAEQEVHALAQADTIVARHVEEIEGEIAARAQSQEDVKA